jgi:hypothetical protein
MSYHFRPAETSSTKPRIGLYSESGCGKTFSALLLAKGFAGDMSKVGMIETESGRGEMYAAHKTVGGYKVLSIRDNFSPTEYGHAIDVANKEGLQVLIIDSVSHEWEGIGGVLSMAADNEAAGKKGQLVWQKPKIDHQREFMLRLMQTPIPLVIVCMRAKYPMEQVTKDGKKDWQRSKDLAPKQSEDILFEMTVHGWPDSDHNFHITKPRGKEDELGILAIFQDGKPITIETGQRLAAWAKGNAPQTDRRLTSAEQQPSSDTSMGKVHQSLLDELSAHCLGDMVKANELCREMSFYAAKGKDGGPDKEYRFDLDKLPTVSEKWAGSVLGKLRKKVEAETAAQTKTDGDNLPV